jgi:hypothetical protein
MDVEAGFAEAAVRWRMDRAPADSGEARSYFRFRDAGYELADAWAREQAARRLHLEEFQRLGFAELIASLVHEAGLHRAGGPRVRVGRGSGVAGEGAELFRTGTEKGGLLLVRLRPESFEDRDRIVRLLRIDLRHIADMLDPGFGYDPAALDGLEAPVQSLVRDRFMVAWRIAVLEGLHRRFAAEFPVDRGAQRRLLSRAFRGLGEELLALLYGALAAGRPPARRLLEAARTGEARALLRAEVGTSRP